MPGPGKGTGLFFVEIARPPHNTEDFTFILRPVFSNCTRRKLNL